MQLHRKRALPISTMPIPVQDVPADIFRLILSHVAPVDYLKVKLVSKSFSSWASTEFNWEHMTKDEVIKGHTSLEACLPRTRRLKDFICIHCGRVKSTNSFSDNQAVKTNHKRICISCGISQRIYTKGQLPKINGEEHIPCWHCLKAVPKYQDWEKKLALGKAALAKLLEGSRTEGARQRYITGDSRTLESSHELQALVFCEPCLKLMMRHKEAALRLTLKSGHADRKDRA